MNKLDLSLCDTTNIALFTAGTINFLQLAYQQITSATIINIIGDDYDPTKVYILYGCRLTVVGGNNTISAGALFYSGEVYLKSSDTTLSGTSGTIITNLTITPFISSLGGDPMTFTVSGPSNAHNIRTYTFVYGTTGTGTLTGNSSSDYLNFVIPTQYLTSGIVLSTVGGFTWTDERVAFSTYDISYSISENRCYLTGVAAYGHPISSGSINVLTLPLIARPSKNTLAIGYIQTSGGPQSIGLTISTTGIVAIDQIPATSSCILQLEGISYRLN